MSRWTGIVLFAIGCGHPSRSPSTPPIESSVSPMSTPPADAAVVPLEDDIPRLAARYVQEYRDLAHALEPRDCAVATARIAAVADAYLDVSRANEIIAHRGGDLLKRFQAALEPYDSELDVTVKAVVESATILRCSPDPAFARQMDRLGKGH